MTPSAKAQVAAVAPAGYAVLISAAGAAGTLLHGWRSPTSRAEQNRAEYRER